jgi:DNA-binding NarL/FixJ family response regulator
LINLDRIFLTGLRKLRESAFYQLSREAIFVTCGMSLTDLSSAQLERAVALLKEKESIQAQLERVNRSLESLGRGEIGAEKAGAVSKKGRPGGRRGRLKKRLLKVLEAAGKEGMTVKDLAKKLGANPENVSIWFYTTGKKVKGIQRVGKAQYAFAAE